MRSVGEGVGVGEGEGEEERGEKQIGVVGVEYEGCDLAENILSEGSVCIWSERKEREGIRSGCR